MSSVNRETCRDKLATLLSTALVGMGLPAQAVFGYRVGDFAGASPVVVVTVGGSLRNQATLGVGAKNKNIFKLNVYSFVSAANAATSWTEQNVDDRLDLLDKAIADVIADNRGKSNDASLPWDYLELAEDAFSEIVPVTIGGATYWRELYSVIVTVKDT